MSERNVYTEWQTFCPECDTVYYQNEYEPPFTYHCECENGHKWKTVRFDNEIPLRDLWDMDID